MQPNESLKRLMNAQFAARGVTPSPSPSPSSSTQTSPSMAIPFTQAKTPSANVDYGALLKAAVAATETPHVTQEAPTAAPVEVKANDIRSGGTADSAPDMAGAAEVLAAEAGLHDAIDSDDLTDEQILEDLGYHFTDPLEESFVDSSDYEDEEDEDILEVAAKDILEGITFSLDPSQSAAVIGMAQNQYACLIGAAGTGKTTVTRFLLNTLINGDVEAGLEPLRFAKVDLSKYKVSGEDHDATHNEDKKDTKTVVPAIALCAFTGQATQVLKKNMPTSWKRNCMTIHSMLGYAPEEYMRLDGKMGWRFSPTYNKQVKMPWDVFIVDESSMVNIDLWHQILDAAKPNARFYFIGDLNQLPPPIGQGVLGFALSKWSVFELSVVHRQKELAANRIIDTAWRILKGEPPEFDDPTKNPNWRVIGFPLDHDTGKAHSQIVSIAKGLSKQRISASVDPSQPVIYDPWRDRILVQMNGYSEDATGALVGQFPLNESLSAIFADPNEPRVIIDAKRVTKRFAVGYRIMATKNEPANEVDRVTNGLTGRIVGIWENTKWLGDRRLVGNEDEVRENRSLMVAVALGTATEAQTHELEEASREAFELTDVDFSAIAAASTTPEERQSGPASHVVSIDFDNGAHREYDLNSEIEQLQIAYASTTHKAQGAEMPTAIIVVHHASRRMLCRENLYTAVTRASQRVVILYTDFGMRIALTTQKIYGKTLQEKVRQYMRLMGDGDSSMAVMRVRLSTDEV